MCGDPPIGGQLFQVAIFRCQFDSNFGRNGAKLKSMDMKGEGFIYQR